jgi:hypothetical protein
VGGGVFRGIVCFKIGMFGLNFLFVLDGKWVYGFRIW